MVALRVKPNHFCSFWTAYTAAENLATNARIFCARSWTFSDNLDRDFQAYTTVIDLAGIIRARLPTLPQVI
ncbi:MAG: hypothetical protein FJZ75_06105 [Bacteroidetes bacterium]|nr:hypothetical protein [Bacteroidota bacterium]